VPCSRAVSGIAVAKKRKEKHIPLSDSIWKLMILVVQLIHMQESREADDRYGQFPLAAKTVSVVCMLESRASSHIRHTRRLGRQRGWGVIWLMETPVVCKADNTTRPVTAQRQRMTVL
jgi:hypothetical protein